jgi:hypothetical protein
MNDNDIIISICEFMNDNCDVSPLSIDYAELDEELGLPDGSTAKHLAAAAEDCGFEIKRRGEQKAMLAKTITIA